MRQPPAPASAVATAIDGELVGLDRSVVGITQLSEPKADHLVFAADTARYASDIAAALARGAVVLVPAGSALEPGSGSVIFVENPRGAFASAVRRFFAPVVSPGIAP